MTEAARLACSFASGSVVGFFIGMTGIGGGVLVLPALILVVRVDPVAALGTALLYSLMTKAVAGLHHWRLGNIQGRMSLWTGLGVVPGVLLASWTVMELKRLHPAATEAGVRFAAGVVVLFGFILMAWNTFATLRSSAPCSAKPPTPPKRLRRLDATQGEEESLRSTSRARPAAPDGAGQALAPLPRPRSGAVGFGLLLGVVMGATSIGGGVFMLPALMAWFGLTPRQAIGTSTLVSLLAAVVGSIAYQSGGELDGAVAVSMFLGSLPAVYLGARAAARLPARSLRFCVLAAMIVSAAMLLLGNSGARR